MGENERRGGKKGDDEQYTTYTKRYIAKPTIILHISISYSNSLLSLL